MVRPSALAVLRLMTSSNFVGCCTGRSVGLEPCRNHVHVSCGAAEQVRNARSVGHEATKFRELPRHCDRGQPMPCGKIDNMSSLAEKHWARQYDESIGALSGHRQECAIEVGCLPHLHEFKLHQQSACCSLHLLHHLTHRRLAVSARMPEGSNARDSGKSPLEQLQPLSGKLRAKERHSGNVAARPREAGHEAVPDGVAHGRHHDRRSGGRFFCSAGRGSIAGDNKVEIEMNELRR